MNRLLVCFLVFGLLLTNKNQCQAFSNSSRRFGQPYPAQAKRINGSMFSKISAPTQLLSTREDESPLHATKNNDNIITRARTRRSARTIVRILPVLATALFLFLAPQSARAAIIDSTTRGGTAASALGARNLGAAALMLVSLAVIPLSITGLPTLSKSLLTSASRCAVQVFFLGSVLLQRIMGASQPLLVMAWIVGVGLIAGKETYSRTQYTYSAMKRHVYTSILCGGLTVLGLSLVLGVLGVIHPWYKPGVWIPVAGMLFGNTLSASALGTSTITKSFATKQGQIELFLARGATSQEATLPIVRDALLTALTPTINGLAVTGIVHIPGMMTGQILAGQSAPQAAAYQVMINFLIATTACATVQLLIRAAVGALMDSQNHRLYPNRLTPAITTTTSNTDAKSTRSGRTRGPSSLITWFSSSNREKMGSENLSEKALSTAKAKMTTVAVPTTMNSTTTRDETELQQVVLEARDIHVPRANATISFKCRPGDRIGISGRSGAGKSQILRTIAQLQGWDKGVLIFNGENVDKLSTPKYRSRVCLVPQSTQILEGTPRMFYEQSLQFHCHRTRMEQQPDFEALVNTLEQMGIDPSFGILDREWSQLSGGEAQRVSLAIALSLKPNVLLLDESTSALDESTCKLVEKVLVEAKLPIVMVSHSIDQLDRLCTHRIDL